MTTPKTNDALGAGARRILAVGELPPLDAALPPLFRDGTIADLTLRPLKKFNDSRGWLCELFRHDELPEEVHPTMAYISMTLPGVARGPHEHHEQSDVFCFIGPSTFKLYLWDCRAASPSRGVRHVELVGIDRPMLVVIPPGIVHAYRNVGTDPGIVFNCPNRLYKGWGRAQPVDEIRHEELENSPFVLD